MKVKEIASFLGGTLVGESEAEILRVAAVETASKNAITFLEKIDPSKNLNEISASCVLTKKEFEQSLPCPRIEVESPKLSFALIAEILHPRKALDSEIHKSAVISDTASIGNEVFIGAFCCVGENSSVGDKTQIRAGAKIGDNVKIGKNCVLHPNVFVEDNCTIGDNIILHSGVVIGADGFGFVRGDEDYVKFPQIGTVVIEDNVEIGANSCVDRGALGETRIGQGTKIDNLVQVAHNVQIGKRVVIASQTGISGSVVIEDDCVIGGQVGFGDHCTIKSGAVIGSQAGVLPGKIVREGVWWGTPVQPLNDYKKLNAHINSLPRIKKQIKELKQLISELEKQ